MNALQFFFQWYSGAVWSNILASVLWSVLVGVPAFFWGRSKARKHIQRIHDRFNSQDAQMALHDARLKAIHKHLKKEP